tara:strand:- start:8434 stop:9003 length:570 start_codon:yes stop_codon:yes gene_type:complete
MNGNSIGICVGHSRDGDQGASSLGNITEWYYNWSVARHFADALEVFGLEAVVFNKYEGKSYNTAIKWLARELKEREIDLAVELHFNAATPAAHGSEVLYWHSSSKGKQLANCMQQAILESFPDTRDRGIKGKEKGARGSFFLRMTHCPAVLVEPFFGSNAEDWNTFKNAQQQLGYAYANAVNNFLSDKT